MGGRASEQSLSMPWLLALNEGCSAHRTAALGEPVHVREVFTDLHISNISSHSRISVLAFLWAWQQHKWGKEATGGLPHVRIALALEPLWIRTCAPGWHVTVLRRPLPNDFIEALHNMRERRLPGLGTEAGVVVSV